MKKYARLGRDWMTNARTSTGFLPRMSDISPKRPAEKKVRRFFTESESAVTS
jgi:hypothetical protein